jgi:hypothetical protein
MKKPTISAEHRQRLKARKAAGADTRKLAEQLLREKYKNK